ncbi:hypothetical protein [Microbulbifer hydrolyticus]|uniref:DUF3300 domain-containing protein n=1 Tax=Microbulbifer hydrolyticus TaxID=48074 RepID=A0A6P1TB85_9GAMM|nr:hypothetical protein [Microbulbifer hydrolyticus]MBB5210521.1 hypothetical protein [Microbulbifer hydrolyticus]QHQ39005.1 hypothetical protein GTQ55_08415 [Microbulbifer hydrolyticus]
MRQVPYRLLAALTITLTLGGCVTYPAAPPVVVGGTYVRKAPPVYSYSVITDPGYRYYDDTLGVYVFYDRSDVFYRQGRYYRWYQDHWISASHWGGRWYPAPNFYISANFNDRWHTRLRRHGHHYAGGHHDRPPRRHGHDDGYNRRDRLDSNGNRYDRRDKGQGRREKALDRREKRQDRREIVLDRREKRQNPGRGGEHRFVGMAEPKRRASQADNRDGDRHSDRRNPRGNPGRDERVVKRADKPTVIRDPRVVPAVERPGIDRRTVRDRPKPQSQRGQRPRSTPDDRRNTSTKPASRQEREQPKKKEKGKKAEKKADKRDQVRLVHEPLNPRSSEAQRRIH